MGPRAEVGARRLGTAVAAGRTVVAAEGSLGLAPAPGPAPGLDPGRSILEAAACGMRVDVAAVVAAVIVAVEVGSVVVVVVVEEEEVPEATVAEV